MVRLATIVSFPCLWAATYALDLTNLAFPAKKAASPLKIDLQCLDGIRYYTNITVGSPPQEVTLAVDTNSRDIIVPAANSDLCQAGSCKYGSYDNQRSKTFINIADPCVTYLRLLWYKCPKIFTLKSVDETITFAKHTFERWNLGLYVRPVYPMGTFGLGYPLKFVTMSADSHRPARTLLHLLSYKGIIPSASVALKFTDPPNMILGGIDSSAFVGKIALQNIVRKAYKPNFEQNAIRLHGLSLGGDLIRTQEYDFSVAINTYNFTNYLPVRLISQLKARYDIEYYNFTRGYHHNVPWYIFDHQTDRNIIEAPVYTIGSVDCALKQSTENITFTFAHFSIAIPLSEFIFDINDFIQRELTAEVSEMNISPKGIRHKCGLAFNAVLDDGWDKTSPYSLGMSFLKHVYLVQDQDSHQIGFGHLNPERVEEAEVHEVARGKGGLRQTLLSLDALEE